MPPALTTGAPIGALDSHYIEQAQQSPVYDAEDPWARVVDSRQQNIIEAQNQLSEMDKLRESKLFKLGSVMSAFGSAYTGGPSVLDRYNAQRSALQDQIGQGRMGIEDLNLQRHMLEQKARMGAGAEAPSAVREYEYWQKLSPEEQQRYLTLQRNTQQRIGDQLFDTASGTPVEMLSDEQLGELYQRRIQNKRGEAGASKQGQNDAEAAKVSKANAQAFETFQVGMQGLTESLANTATGPVQGKFPAFSAEARTAEGAVAAMAPLLKQLFRSAGEGNFTDSDQKLLMDMLPTREDPPETVQMKTDLINKIVRSKLGMDVDIARDPAEQAADAGFKIISVE